MSDKHHINRINQWAKHLGLVDVNDLDWIPDNVVKIVNFIERGSYSNATKEAHLFTLVKVLKEFDDPRVQQVMINARQYLSHNNNQRNKQEMDASEVKSWRDHAYFKKKFLDIAGDYTIDALILGLYTMIPPIRNDYNGMRVVMNTDPYKFKNEKENYMIINDDGFYLVMNDYKTKKIYGSKVIDLLNNLLPDEVLDEIRFMKKYIVKSIEINPRPYLLGDKALTKRQVILGLERNFKQEEITPTIGIMRSSYITWIHDVYNKYSIKKTVAEIMGHDLMTAERDYKKL
jgi:hypothetical protein